ncbi:hypothetical protein COEREDRAFT_78978 [Coemansia reversa NRRL 1564]|uniref:Uncharacterized protein n=1 Tax=Coemansia reversa (strain ATCC 12441 / NRRL 1564) TaxID=763665 RepID=A0A2G5BKY0_COERN|nr:hypothetical protein COEREDRAFT_78978 [Coemansia reversa NRRL 1564]|eukprot:PIA19675.1 hypothetical protein COEREDRAFT_78978 [Coemansia reversa NRRL 1564]
MAKQKRNLNWEISVLEAKMGQGKSMWKAKAKEAKQKRKEARHNKAMDGAKIRDAYILKDTKVQESVPEDFSELETKLQRLRVEKANQKIHAISKHAKIILRRIIALETQCQARKVKRFEKKLEEITNAKNISAADAAKEREVTEALISNCRENRKVLDEVSIDEVLECFMYKLKNSNPTLRNALGVTPLTPESEKLTKNKYIQQRILGAQKTINVMRLHSNNITGIILGTTVKKMEKEVKKAKNSARAQRAAIRKSEAKESDANKSISGPDDDSQDTTSEAPASTFVGSLGDYVDSESDNGTTETKREGSKRKHADNYDYDEEADQEFETIYNGKAATKNRPGQRARRKQYENMYGEEANHIKLSKKEKNHHSSANSSQPATAEKDEEVHPSWQAKRHEKELLEQAKSVKGKKIVFD